MKAITYREFGEPADVLAAADAPLPEPGSGQLRLRVVRSPIHNHDLATIRGIYGVRPALPAIAGSEMAGVVDAVGEGVHGFVPGQRIATMARGSWAQYALADAASAAPVPDALSDDAACQLLAMPLSAIILFDDLNVRAGDWIVQNAANGAVGRILHKLADKAGVNVISLVRREDSAAALRSHGAQHVVVSADPAWPKRVREIAGDAPIARVVDSVCDADSLQLNRLLAPHGQHVVFGALGGKPLAVDPGALIFGETQIRGFWASGWLTRSTPQERMQAIGRVFALALAGDLPLPVASVHPLEDIRAAVVAAETPGRPGKVLLAP